MCRRINQEESLTAGPSSGMALAGALKAIPDEPGNVVVVIFPDSIFKYASSILGNLTDLGKAPSSGTKREQLLDSMVENARVNSHLAIDIDEAHDLWKEQSPVVIDVREPEAHSQRHIPGAINMPLNELSDLAAFLPEDRDAPVLSAFANEGTFHCLGCYFSTALVTEMLGVSQGAQKLGMSKVLLLHQPETSLGSSHLPLDSIVRRSAFISDRHTQLRTVSL